jgi:hypothetical protein
VPNKKLGWKYKENITLCFAYFHIQLMMIFTVYNLNLKVVEKLEVCCFENSFYTIFIYLRGTDLLSKYQVETI